MTEAEGREEATGISGRDNLIRQLPVILLGLAMAVAGAWILSLTSNLTFIADEWNLLLLRQGWGVGQIMDPFNGHPIMAPAFVFKSLQDVFGMESARPMQVTATAAFLLTNALLFTYVRRRIGPWGALIATMLILFLGAAFEDLLFAFQIGYFGSLAAGLGALIALDRDDHKGDVAASVLLIASLTFSSVGIAFVAAGAAEWALNPRDRKRRAFVPGAAMLFYALWWLGWGHQASAESLEPAFQLSVLPKVPDYVFDMLAAALVSLAGLATGDGSELEQPNLIWGQIAAVLVVGLAIWRLRSLERIPRSFLVTGAGALCLYLLFALAQDAYIEYGASEVRAATLSRYQLPTALFVVLMAANLLKSLRLPSWSLGVAAVLSLFAISGGIQLMSDKAHERWEPAAAYTKAILTGIELSAPDNPAGQSFRPGTSFDVPVQDYLAAVEAHGSPAVRLAELRSFDPPFRTTADAAMIEASGIMLTGAPPVFAEPACRKTSKKRKLELAPGPWYVENRGSTDLALSLARISDTPAIGIGAVLPRATAGMELPAGGLKEAWILSFSGDGPAKVCTQRMPRG